MAKRDFNLIGVGVGPANLALITAMLDCGEPHAQAQDAVFFEMASRFRWQYRLTGIGRLQVPYLKDLALQRNPRSRFTFLNFLFEMGRLEAFINLRDLYPSLDEIEEYFSWVAQIAAPLIRYDHEVESVEPVTDRNGTITRLRVAVTSGTATNAYFTSTLVLGCGRRPHVPTCVRSALGRRITHSSWNGREATPVSACRGALESFAVVGSGQSAIEASIAILKGSKATLDIYLRGAAPLAIDDNPFVNYWYQSSGEEVFRSLPRASRSAVLQSLRNTNRGVSDRDLLDSLFRLHYEHLRSGESRVRFHPMNEPIAIVEKESGVECTFRDLVTRKINSQIVDRVVLATGYSPPDWTILDGVRNWLVRDEAGAWVIKPSRRLCMKDGCSARIFVNGHFDDSLGPSDSTLSTIAKRGGELWNQILQDRG